MNAATMRRRPVPARRRRRGRGVGLVELLIALTITAGLLTATAVGVHASITAYRTNQELSSLGQRGRLAMHRMLTSIRAAERHLPESDDAAADFRGGLVVSDSGIAMDTPDGKVLAYYHDPATQRLMVKVGTQDHVLLEGVEEFQVRMEPMRSQAHIRSGLHYDLLRRATLLLTIHTTAATAHQSETTGRQSVTISSSVAPRRNTW